MIFFPSLAYLISLSCSQIAVQSIGNEKRVQIFYGLGILFLIIALVIPAQTITIVMASIVACLSLEYFIPSIRYKKISQENLKAFQYFIISSFILHIYFLVHPIVEAAWGFKGDVFYMGLIGVVVLDFKNYWIHRFQHKFNWWWKIHFVHHDQSEIYTFSSAPVFLPEWVFLRLILSSVIVYAFGLPFYTIVLYGYFAVISGIWSHANFTIPRSVSSVLEWFIVTPDYHRHHHKSDSQFERSNYADIFTIWDRIFGTYKEPLSINEQSFKQNPKPKYKNIFADQTSVLTSFWNSNKN